ncbi:hypothetical protein UFOVP633_48 [uncultured Caudovirales phage]|uniref:Uncharacterized protein n=1 Tax=uncultured Caudovirales phage TaxID=2100421 RepID=A0A6J5N5B8_9CAUD|nr:hypothetical protein UFOVP633_48 [uncultured Caudovirales phage]
MKQSSIEWLRKELETIPNYSAFYTNNYQWIDSIMNEAKAMEKEQIFDAWENGYREFYDGSSTPEQYYRETYEEK